MRRRAGLRRLCYLPLAVACHLLETGFRVVRRLVPRSRLFLRGLGGDRATIAYHHLLNFGTPPDLAHPVTYAEKMSWLKLNHDNPLVTLCSDKIAVRRYLERKGLAQLAVPVVAVAARARDLDLSALPGRFVAKTNHGSNFYVVCHDRRALDPGRFVRKFDAWLACDFSRWFAETNYRGIVPRILVEEYLDGAAEMTEYKFFCFQGEPRFVSVIVNRRGDNPVRSIRDMAWRAQGFGSRGLIIDREERPRPPQFAALQEYARALARDFLHVRVDFMVVGGRVFFSELTFYNLGGFTPLEPDSMNAVVGSWIDLSRAPRYAAIGREVAAAIEVDASEVRG